MSLFVDCGRAGKSFSGSHPKQFSHRLAGLYGKGLIQEGQVSTSGAESEDRDILAAGPIERYLWYFLLNVSDQHSFDKATHIETKETLIDHLGYSLGSVSLVTALQIATSWSLHSCLLSFPLFSFIKRVLIHYNHPYCLLME